MLQVYTVEKAFYLDLVTKEEQQLQNTTCFVLIPSRNGPMSTMLPAMFIFLTSTLQQPKLNIPGLYCQGNPSLNYLHWKDTNHRM